jgi:hypothetical protein
MQAILRSSAAIVLGLLVALALATGVEVFGNVVHPFPADYDGSMEQTCAHVERFPAWVLAAVVPAWGFTALAGVWTAGRLANRGCALAVGLLLVAAVAFNVAMLPYPLWFKLAAVIAIVAAVSCGTYLSRPRVTPTLSVAT